MGRIEYEHERKQLSDSRYVRSDTYAGTLYEMRVADDGEVITCRKDDGAVIGSTFRLPTPNAPPSKKPFAWDVRMAGYSNLATYTMTPNAMYKYADVLGLEPTHLALYGALSYIRWNANMPYPSQERLAKWAGMSVSTLNRTTTDLENRGLLIVIRKDKDTHVYNLHPLFDALDALERDESPPQVDFAAIKKHKQELYKKLGKTQPKEKNARDENLGNDTPAEKETRKTQAIPKATVAARLSDKQQAIQDEQNRMWGPLRRGTDTDVDADTSGSTYVFPDSPYG